MGPRAYIMTFMLSWTKSGVAFSSGVWNGLGMACLRVRIQDTALLVRLADVRARTIIFLWRSSPYKRGAILAHAFAWMFGSVHYEREIIRSVGIRHPWYHWSSTAAYSKFPYDLPYSVLIMTALQRCSMCPGAILSCS
ncbi:hypothetical protein BV20DRAFT_58348 [Pilatotrama ljubarskyi]|nr:hypothetical protein BV20DRAFT_58348 [Pilatotrama ljubarskyi]